MNPIQEFFNLFYHLDFVSLSITIFAGALWAYLSRNWEIDKRTLFVILSLYSPLLIGRILYTATSGEEPNTLASIYYLVYFASAFLTRKYLHGTLTDSAARSED